MEIPASEFDFFQDGFHRGFDWQIDEDCSTQTPIFLTPSPRESSSPSTPHTSTTDPVHQMGYIPPTPSNPADFHQDFAQDRFGSLVLEVDCQPAQGRFELPSSAEEFGYTNLQPTKTENTEALLDLKTKRQDVKYASTNWSFVPHFVPCNQQKTLHKAASADEKSRPFENDHVDYAISQSMKTLPRNVLAHHDSKEKHASITTQQVKAESRFIGCKKIKLEESGALSSVLKKKKKRGSVKPFIIYCNYMRPIIRRVNPMVSNHHLMRLIGDEWNKLDSKQKLAFLESHPTSEMSFVDVTNDVPVHCLRKRSRDQQRMDESTDTSVYLSEAFLNSETIL